MKRIMLRNAVAALMLTAFAVPVSAQMTGTVSKIRQTGAIVIAHQQSADPFSYVVDGKPVGYSMDICLRVVDQLRMQLSMPSMRIEYLPVNSDTRFSSLREGKADLECGTTTNTRERQRIVAFSVTTFVAGTRLLSKKNSGIRMLLNLKNKRVVVLKNTTNESQVREFNDRFRYNITVVPVTSETEAMQMVNDGRADAFCTDDVILAALAANMPNAGEWMLTVQALSVEPYGIMMRRGDPAFKRAVDDAIIALFRSGEIHKIYKKWFVSPIPPRGINMNLPMSDVLEKVIKKPTDSENPAFYH